jgi:SAM-dependent methyltransferase
MLSNPFGVLLYLLLRNDISWELLSAGEKEVILEANRNYNIGRDDYANPEKYGAERYKGGKNWDFSQLQENDHLAQALLEILEENKPKKVLEIGPGAGFYTKIICQYHTVEYYTAIDIGQAFLEYLKPRLEKIKMQKRFSYELICSEVTEVGLSDRYDLILLFSTVHHVPNRVVLFSNLTNMLLENGCIFCFDPSHYIFRVYDLIKKCICNGYLKKEYYLDKRNLSTHHMCSYGEYKKIVRKVGGLKIKKVLYKLPNKVKKYNWLFVPNSWFSTEIGIIFKKSK